MPDRGSSKQSGASRRRAAPFACRLVVMVRQPRAGRTKTRLARGIGAVGALAFYRHATAATLARLAVPDGRWRTLLSVTPDHAVGAPGWPPRIPRVRQGGGGLGARMQRILDEAPPGPVIIVGSDIPAVRAAHVAAAFRLLAGADAVLGPAEDGGYWLVGLRRACRTDRIFAGVRWSTSYALADTRANLDRLGLRTALAARLSDVDEAADLARAGAHAGRVILPPL